MEKTKLNVTFPIWSPFALLFLGVWLIAAPGTFGYFGTVLSDSDLFCGFLLLIFGWKLRSNPKPWVFWAVSLIGVWLQFAPLALRIPQAAGYLNDTLIGVLAIFCSLLLPKPKESRGAQIPKGWSYNPSSYAQRLPVIFLAGLGWFMARYLDSYQLGFIDTIWDPFFGHGTIDVITSNISRSLPVPDAGLGAFAYTLEFLLGCHGSSARWRTAPWLVLSFGILVVPVGLVSILLITLQPLIVHAWCTICLFTALAMLIMITLTIDEVIASLQLLKRSRKSGLSVRDVLWHGWPDDKEIADPRETPLNAPSEKLLKAFFWGCGMPWNLALSALIGAALMAIPAWLQFTGPMADADHVFGALIVVIAVISMAEIVRKTRYLLWLFAAVIAIIALITTQGMALAIHIVIAILLILLAVRKGKIKESYGR